MIDSDALASLLASSSNPWEIEYTASIDSTNVELGRRYAGSTEAPWLVLWAEEQTNGRGRLDRQWLSVPGSDITASVIFPSPTSRADTPKLSLCAGLALVNILSRNYDLQAEVRWPNDVLTGNGKIAGILSSYISEPDAVVCGIGINVNSKPGEIELDKYGRRTTMLAELGREVSRESFFASWLLAFEGLWELAHENRIDDLASAFNTMSFYKGRRVRVLIGGGADRDEDPARDQIEGVAGSLDGTGALLVEQADGSSYPISVEDLIIPLD